MAEVVAVCISERKGIAKHPVSEIALKVNHGIVGDAHAGKWHRQVSLLGEESVDKMKKVFPDIPVGAFAENILVRGLTLYTLPVGTRLSVGETLLEVTQIGKECHADCAIRKQVGDCVMPREGVFAKVLKEGTVRPGDSLKVVNEPSKNILITGGTTFVSRTAAEFFRDRGYEVYCLNRNSRPQVEGIHLIEADRHDLGDKLKDAPYFDGVLDITAYDEKDINDLLDHIGPFGKYIFVSSSAVYPDDGAQPFTEKSEVGPNRFWGKYGTDKIEAEKALFSRVENACVLRPPYLYGPLNGLYRESFVFDCAKADREFFLPGDGSMKMQFFHVEDLCRVMEKVLCGDTDERILNVGNAESITVREWVRLCYEAMGKEPIYREVFGDVEQRKYFSFSNYEYFLDTALQRALLPETIPFEKGIQESAAWYEKEGSIVNKKDYIRYIDEFLRD